MVPSIAYEKDSKKKETEKMRDVKCDTRGEERCYSTTERKKGVEDRCCVKYTSNGGPGGGIRQITASSRSGYKPPLITRESSKYVGGGSSNSSSSSSSHGSNGHHRDQAAAKHEAPAASSNRSNATAATVAAEQTHKIAASKGRHAVAAALAHHEAICGRTGYRSALPPTAVSAVCYEVRRAAKKFQPCHKVRWQRGKYVRDECGSGIVPVRFDIGPCKRLWCKTPLSMYQATIGELGRQLLCGERVVQRDVWPAPPCNMQEYIMPPCHGYYRRYDCIRPCEEDYAYIKQGKKYYRDRVQRYWEPCLPPQQKHTRNVNEFGPHNAALALKLRRQNMDIPCW